MSETLLLQDDAGLEPQINEHALSDLIVWVLRIGVWLAAAVVLLGYAGLLRHGIPNVDLRRFVHKPLTTHYGILSILGHLRYRHSPRDIIDVGLLILILTPIIRVAMSIVVFLYEKDKLYASLTSFVLLVLLYGLLGG